MSSAFVAETLARNISSKAVLRAYLVPEGRNASEGEHYIVKAGRQVEQIVLNL